ncbi:GIY-YIG nuclease family protein [Mesohalobacter halotolerans]|uniref:GIY-YIG nuclease family protein n=1 Tax=Mesohalobacter halotolerans TaxID=1883405 RepID=UPI00269AAF17|nr:GIY-YIG nuclease family protein [Mesohalobacter halotolerans]
MKKSYTYLLKNKNNSVIYTGVTSNLLKRIYQHKTGIFKGFTKRYNCNKLVYYEEFRDINEAIQKGKTNKSRQSTKKDRPDK